MTKRPQNVVRMVRRYGAIAGNGTRCLPDNVCLGTTAEDQLRADQNLPFLLATKQALGARNLFVSIEPMLSPVDLTRIDPVKRRGTDVPEDAYDALRGQLASGAEVGLAKLDWVIVGGESGPGARSMVLGWAKDVVRQCAAAGVPVLVKQIGACPTNREGVAHPVTDAKGGDMAEWPLELRVREFPTLFTPAETQPNAASDGIDVVRPSDTFFSIRSQKGLHPY